MVGFVLILIIWTFNILGARPTIEDGVSEFGGLDREIRGLEGGQTHRHDPAVELSGQAPL